MTNGLSGEAEKSYAAVRRRLREIQGIDDEINRLDLDPFTCHHAYLERHEGGSNTLDNCFYLRWSQHRRLHDIQEGRRKPWVLPESDK